MAKKCLWIEGATKHSYWAEAPSEIPQETTETVDSLDLAEVTRTLATIKEWLESEKPSQEDAMEVFQYELKNANRTGAVGDEGCLTEYLEN
tara:strand:+ start:110 stop:382 length:273 start_codon:yes stop_codon:yes gene_type:complete